MNRTKAITALLLLCATAFVVHALAHPPEAGAPARPLGERTLEVEGWSTQRRTLSERQYTILESREILFQEFRRGPQEVQVCIAVAGGNRKVAHPPAVCYRGQGWAISDQSERRETLGGRERPVQEIRISKDGREQLVWSWYRVGDEETSSYLRQQWWGLRSDLGRTARPSALWRFATPLGTGEDQDLEPARARLRSFLDAGVPALERILAERDP